MHLNNMHNIITMGDIISLFTLCENEKITDQYNCNGHGKSSTHKRTTCEFFFYLFIDFMEIEVNRAMYQCACIIANAVHLMFLYI